MNLEIDDTSGIADRLESEGAHLDGKTIREIIESVPSARRLVVAAAIRNLGAVKKYWSKSKDDWVEEPDTNAQLKAIAFLAAYSDGMPTQTTLNVNVNKGAPDDADLEKALNSSPALRSRLAKLVGPAN